MIVSAASVLSILAACMLREAIRATADSLTLQSQSFDAKQRNVRCKLLIHPFVHDTPILARAFALFSSRQK